jgi:hypothetical protein
MSSWSNPTRGFPVKTKQPALSISHYFQTLPYNDTITNLLQFFYSYVYCKKNVELLYVYDPFFKNLLKEESMIKYLKEVPKGTQPLNYSTVKKSGSAESMRFDMLRRNAQAMLRYQSPVEMAITALIQNESLERVRFDIGIIVMGRTPAHVYLNAISTFQNQLKKTDLSIFVVNANNSVYDDIVDGANTSWDFKLLSTPSSPITLLTELHILQAVPNLVAPLSSDFGKLLYVTSRVEHSSDTFISVDSSEWAPY